MIFFSARGMDPFLVC